MRFPEEGSRRAQPVAQGAGVTSPPRITTAAPGTVTIAAHNKQPNTTSADARAYRLGQRVMGRGLRSGFASVGVMVGGDSPE